MSEHEDGPQNEHSSGDDHGHGHIELEYHPSLPISMAKLCMWLFLSTEIMFFAAFIGSYIVIRFGVPAGTWPQPHDVHLVEWIGAANTFVLICSSLTVVLALEAAKRDQAGKAKGFLLITLLLGMLFLGVKAYEYKGKFDHGIYPQYPHSLIYERADVNYLTAVRTRLETLQQELGKKQEGLSAEAQAERERRLGRVKQLLGGSVLWTEQMVSKHWAKPDHFKNSLAKPLNHVDAKAAIKDLASLIYKTGLHGHSAAKHSTSEHAAGEHGPNQLGADQHDHGHGALALEKKYLEAQRELIENDRKLNDKIHQDNVDKAKTLDKTLLSLDAKNPKQKEQAKKLRQELQELNKKIVAAQMWQKQLADREAHINLGIDLIKAKHGINDKEKWLKLPMVIPSGNMWASTYF